MRLAKKAKQHTNRSINYSLLALKHYTSKLSTYEDLTSLRTFGFRGEALSSLCALSTFGIITAQADQAPKATKLAFEVSGKLKSTQLVAGQKGTIVSVEGLFSRLPVRRRELEKNIKREYGKVLALLHAYACISIGVRFSVKNQMPRGKSVVVFATKSNPTTRENISNVYGAKTLLALMPLDLTLEYEPSMAARRLSRSEGKANKILVQGHVSKPVFGDGRQTPDRQMFFVNSRPCSLPQIAKAFNEVYKSFNVSQLPFVFANFEMDTDAYDVNVSPDKRTILLHDAGALLESLKESLTELFETQDQTVPHSTVSAATQSTLKPMVSQRLPSPNVASRRTEREDHMDYSQELGDGDGYKQSSDPKTPQSSTKNLLGKFDDKTREVSLAARDPQESSPVIPESSPARVMHSEEPPENDTESGRETPGQGDVGQQPQQETDEDAPDSTGSTQWSHHVVQQGKPSPKPGVVQNAYDRMRVRRPPAEMATITVGDRTYKSLIGNDTTARKQGHYPGMKYKDTARRAQQPSRGKLGLQLNSFTAPGTQSREIEPGPNELSEEEGSGSVYNSAHSDIDMDQEDFAESQDENDETRPNPEDDDGSDAGSDENYAPDEEAREKERERERVEKLIRAAEKTISEPSEHNIKRAKKMSKRSVGKDSTVQLMCRIDTSIEKIELQMKTLQKRFQHLDDKLPRPNLAAGDLESQTSPEAKLSLTVLKEDFANMRIIGQFNLGFIIATRPKTERDGPANDGNSEGDELFIIDQHASDEKYNFERLQAETTVQNQKLVQPKTLDLTAVEEEVIIDNLATLEKNGFVVQVDTSGDEPIGRRCKLISLPLSKEVVFNVKDLEELIVLLSESPQTQPQSYQHSEVGDEDDNPSYPFANQYVPRPSKVRKMFAMRACRSSIMIGKNLTNKQMGNVVRHMGEIDKPWNCPHGRPTMRHLMSMDEWNEWDEWGYGKGESVFKDKAGRGKRVWKEFLEDFGDKE